MNKQQTLTSAIEQMKELYGEEIKRVPAQENWVDKGPIRTHSAHYYKPSDYLPYRVVRQIR